MKYIKCNINLPKNSEIHQINELAHFYQKNNNGSLKLEIIFKPYTKIVITCAPDGESILIENTDLQSIDLAEYGKLFIKNLDNDPFFNHYLNLKILNYGFISSDCCNKNVGFYFEFIDSKTLHIINLGDEIFYYNKIPKIIIMEESLIFRKVN